MGSLANLKSYTFDGETLQDMADIEAQSSIGVEDRIHLCFALGKGFEDAGQFEQSFTYYEKGNRLKLISTGYDVARTEEAMAAQVDACSGQSFANLHGGFPSPEPIFIVGMPRAGST